MDIELRISKYIFAGSNPDASIWLALPIPGTAVEINKISNCSFEYALKVLNNSAMTLYPFYYMRGCSGDALQFV